MRRKEILCLPKREIEKRKRKFSTVRSTVKKPLNKNLFLGGALFLLGLALVVLVTPQNPLQAFSPTGCEGDCTQCHAINNQDVKGILQGLKIAQAEVLGIQMSPIKGLWEVTINDRGKRGVLYVDFSKNYVLPGPIIEVKTGANKTMEKLGKIQEKKKVDFSKIPLPSLLVLGNPRASQRVVVFTDPDCPYCGKLHAELEKIVQERSDIAFHILLFPLAMHKDAYWKSKSILCNRSLKMLEEAFAQRPIPRLECDTKDIDNNIRLAEALGISGTPTLVAPDGRVHSGYLAAKQVMDFIQGSP
jgi:thiol:disulfide interchange protein DsbC